jgi:Family of unknown function (DUF6644)
LLIVDCIADSKSTINQQSAITNQQSGKTDMAYDFFMWCETTAIHDAIANSLWAFAVIESIHLLALAAIGGAVLVVDMRMLGFGLKQQPINEVARNAYPWLVGSLIVMIATGIPLFLSEPTKCYYSYPFWVKMTALALAIVFTFTIRRMVTRADESRTRPALYKLTALVSLALWFTVGAAGRWIGFSG